MDAALWWELFWPCGLFAAHNVPWVQEDFSSIARHLSGLKCYPHFNPANSLGSQVQGKDTHVS